MPRRFPGLSIRRVETSANWQMAITVINAVSFRFRGPLSHPRKKTLDRCFEIATSIALARVGPLPKALDEVSHPAWNRFGALY